MSPSGTGYVIGRHPGYGQPYSATWIVCGIKPDLAMGKASPVRRFTGVAQEQSGVDRAMGQHIAGR